MHSSDDGKKPAQEIDQRALMEEIRRLGRVAEQAEKKAGRLEEENRDLKKRQSVSDVKIKTLEKQTKNLEKVAVIDELTGILNRRGLSKAVQGEMARVNREETEFCVVYFDIDHFKRVNDVLGHSGGDYVLRRVTDTISKNLREYDVVGRYGGEEFVVVLPKTELQNAVKVAEKLRGIIGRTKFEYKGTELPITISLGVASSRDENDIERLLDLADKAMYSAKTGGRNCTYASVCETSLSKDEFEGIMKRPEIVGLIEKYRTGMITSIKRGRITIPFSDILRKDLVVKDGEINGGIKIITKGSAIPVCTAFLGGPYGKLNPVHDAGDQIIAGMRKSGLAILPKDEQGRIIRFWMTGPGDINFLNFKVTERCPMRCTYCNIEQREMETAMTDDDWHGLIDAVSMGGTRKGSILGITGGEPLKEYELVFDLIKHAKRMGMITTVNTNAILLSGDKGLAEELVKAGIDNVNVSLDSHEPQVENNITRLKNAYGMIMEGLRALAAARGTRKKPKVVINHVITNQNWELFTQFTQWMFDLRIKQGVWFDNINPLPVKDALELCLRFDQIQRFNDYIVPRIVNIAKRYGARLLERKIMEIFGANETGEYRTERMLNASNGIYFGVHDLDTPCAAAPVSLTVDTQGNVFPCTYHREVDPNSEIGQDRILMGNIREHDLREMQKKYFDTLARLPGTNRVCRTLCGPDIHRMNRGVKKYLSRRGVV